MSTQSVLAELAAERERQTAKWGDQSGSRDGTGPDELVQFVASDYASTRDAAKFFTNLSMETHDATFADIILEEVFEALAESEAPLLRAELVQVGAVVVQWIEALDKRGAL